MASGTFATGGTFLRTPSVQQLADRAAIRAVADHDAHGVDRLDADLMRSASWPDAVDDHGVFVATPGSSSSG